MPTTLILTMVGLLFLLIVLVFLYVWRSRMRRKEPMRIEPIETFESLCSLIHNAQTPNETLHRAVSTILGHFPSMTSQNSGSYLKLVKTLCTHPHTDSKLIIRFEKGLRAANPQYTHDIERTLASGLAQRQQI